MDTIWLVKCGQTMLMPKPKARKLVTELVAAKAQNSLTKLVENGYTDFIGFDGENYPIDSMTVELLFGDNSKSE